MSGTIMSKLFKRTNLLQTKDLEEYNKSIESIKLIQNSFNQGNINEALKDIESLYSNLFEAESPISLLIFDSLSLYIKILLYKANFDTIQKLLDDNKEIIDSVLNSKDKNYLNKIISFKLLLAMFYYRKGNYNESENLINQIDSLKNTFDN